MTMAVTGATPATYRTAFVDVLSRVEITTADGVARDFDEGIGRIADLIAALEVGRKAMLIGNGGSAAIASHAQNDLCKAVGVRALVFTESSLLTAIANDDGYAEVFRRPVEQWAECGDLLIAFSSSGESANIVQAALAARARGCSLVTFSGFRASNRLRPLGDVNVYVPACHYGYVEIAHGFVVHCVTDAIAGSAAAGRASPAAPGGVTLHHAAIGPR